MKSETATGPVIAEVQSEAERARLDALAKKIGVLNVSVVSAGRPAPVDYHPEEDVIDTGISGTRPYSVHREATRRF